MGDSIAKRQHVRQRPLVGVGIVLLIVLQLWLSGWAQGVPVAIGQSVSTRTPLVSRTASRPRATHTPTPTQPVALETATATVTDSITPTYTATPEAVASDTPTASPTNTAPPASTQTDTPTPEATASETPTPGATVSETSTTPTETPEATVSETSTTPTETPTPEATVSETSTTPTAETTVSETPTLEATVSETPTTPTETPTASATVSETLTTPTESVTTTGTPTGTLTATPTLTLTPVVSGTLELSINPVQSYIAPGGVTTYTLVITNADTITTTAVLSTTDSDADSFSSSLLANQFELAPGQVATTALSVWASSAAQGLLSDDSTVHVLVSGTESARYTVTTHLLSVQFNRAITGPGTSDHAIAPDTKVQMQVGIRALEPMTATRMTDYLPRAWTVTDTGGGTLSPVDADRQRIDWDVQRLGAGTVLTRTYTVSSPDATTPPPEYSFQTVLTRGPDKFFSDPWLIRLEDPLTVNHFRIGWDTPLAHMKYAAAADAPADAIARFQAFRVRFQVVNDQASPVTWQPLLEWNDSATGTFQPVPASQEVAGVPFYIRPVVDVPDGATIETANFGTGWDTHVPQAGYESTRQNPAPVLTLAAYSFTEVEFSVRATTDADYLHAYYFRLGDASRPLGNVLAQIVMAAPPALRLTQPQYPGVPPAATTRKGKLGSASNTDPNSNPHGGYTLTTAACAVCHPSHTASSDNLLPQSSAQSTLCFTCHDGSQALTDIKSQYQDTNVPPNDSTTSSFYSHPATVPDSQTAEGPGEFGGVLNRESECGDCHNSHSGDNSLSTPTANGYTVSGALKNISGVGFSGSGSSRTPVLQSSSTYEYELCYKCHTSYTILPTYARPSYQLTDVSTDFNPVNASFHPVEHAGMNSTQEMANNLAGTSPYKLWDFQTGDVVRCVNCHGDYRLANPASPPAVNALLDPHTSANRGLLMNNYRDRNLKPSGEAYQASDFALCYQCHAEAPFVDVSGSARNDTNFRYHGFHLNLLGAYGTGGTGIDTLGAGQGNALCAECHFQPHGQGTNATGNPDGTRLVNFAPDVQPNSLGVLNWDPTARTCSLTCHGHDHNSAPY